MTGTPNNTRKTWAERKERERQNGVIEDLAWDIAQHTARASMVGVQRLESMWPRFKFVPYPELVRCECGSPMVPLPQFSKRHGMLPTWYCATCNLRGIVEACESLRSHVTAIGTVCAQPQQQSQKQQLSPVPEQEEQ